jgi:hypothetical protein
MYKILVTVKFNNQFCVDGKYYNKGDFFVVDYPSSGTPTPAGMLDHIKAHFQKQGAKVITGLASGNFDVKKI